MSNEQKVALYARVSTEEQAEGFSIDAQLQVLSDHCERLGKEIVAKYVDAGVSGKSMKNRHQLAKMLQDAEAGKFGSVLVWKINRLARNTLDLLQIVERLRKAGVTFRSYSESFETETAMGRFALEMMAAVGQLERNTIVDNVKMGMKQRARLGLWNGGVALGYRSIETGDKGRKGREDTRLEVVPEEAELVRRIFQMYESGKGLRAIANQLNHEGLKTRKGNSFGMSAIKTIISNPLYAGYIRYGVFENWSEKRRKGKTGNPILVPGTHEAIIPYDLWANVQTLREQKAKVSPKEYDGKFLLAGLLRCPECGSKMVPSRTKDRLKDGTVLVRRYYSCGLFRDRGASVCRANSLRADDVERIVLDRIRQTALDSSVVADVVARANARRASQSVALQEERASWAKELQEVQLSQQKMLDLYQAAGADKEIVMRRLGELSDKKKHITTRMSEIEEELGYEPSQQLTPEAVATALRSFDFFLSTADVEKKKALLRLAVREIHVTKDKRIDRIDLYFTPEARGRFFG